MSTTRIVRPPSPPRRHHLRRHHNLRKQQHTWAGLDTSASRGNQIRTCADAQAPRLGREAAIAVSCHMCKLLWPQRVRWLGTAGVALPGLPLPVAALASRKLCSRAAVGSRHGRCDAFRTLGPVRIFHHDTSAGRGRLLDAQPAVGVFGARRGCSARSVEKQASDFVEQDAMLFFQLFCIN